MKKQIVSLILAAVIFLGEGISFALDNSYQFTPVVQEMDNQGGYQTQYPLPDTNVNYNQPQNYGNNGYQNGYSGNYNNYNNNEKLRGNVIMVPARTVFNAVLSTPLSSETAIVGDSVSMFLGSDFYYGKNLIAPAGSRLHGSVVKVNKGGYGKRNGQLQIRLTNLVLPSGQVIPITASIVTDDNSGILKAGTKMDVTKEYAKKAAIGAGAGAVLGVVMGALSKGSVGKGAIYGTAVGGGLGLIQPAFERGDNVDLPQNSQFDVVLDQPLTVSIDNLSLY